MAYDLNTTSFVAMIILLLIASHTYIHKTSAAGECGKMPISAAVAKISPCVGVAESANSKVPPACCTRVASLLKTSPSCFCAVFLSPLVKHSGINLAIAISIPKRCSIKNRPVGKKCGRYVLA